jgi:signal transduction histidine kinase
MNTHDALELTAIAATVTVLALVIGAVALRLLRRRSIGAQIVALTSTTVLAVSIGAYVASRAMFISAHDLTALVVVLVAAGGVAIAFGLVFGARLGAVSRTLAETARRIGSEDAGPTSLPRDVPSELAQLAGELELAHERLDDAHAREQALDASRRELVAWVSHDLRTPLAGMRAIAEALEDKIVTDPETVARYLVTLREEVDRLATLVDDLFELSRTQAGVLRLEFARISLDDLVSDALASSQPVAAAKRVTLEGKILGPTAEVHVSAPEVSRALRNLLENAIRHTPNDGSVVVEAGLDRAEPDWAFVSVRDSGGGVPEADLPRIFDVGYQREHARTPGAGAGLGLAIAKGFVEAHNGRLSVANENGGANFTVHLPLEHV